MNWFEKSFGPEYLRLYRHRDDAEASTALTSLFPEHALAGRRVLDLGCGPGRYLQVLYERGAHAVGLDLSGVLLQEARARLTPLQQAPRLVRADMRELPFGSRCFDLVLCMFTTFGYFDPRAVHADLAREIGRVAESVVVLDLVNGHWLEGSLVANSDRVVGGHRVVERRWIESDPWRVCKDTELIDPSRDEVVDRFEERVHLFEVSEIEEWFGQVGFFVEELLGDYDASPFDLSTSPRCLLRLRRRGHGG